MMVGHSNSLELLPSRAAGRTGIGQKYGTWTLVLLDLSLYDALFYVRIVSRSRPRPFPSWKASCEVLR